jgi:hypothetical protein
MGSSLNRLFWICQGNARLRRFVHGKDVRNNIAFATNISCLAKERCIPPTAHFKIKAWLE